MYGQTVMMYINYTIMINEVLMIYINITLVVVYMNQPLIMCTNYLLDKTRIGITNKGSIITIGRGFIGMN